VTILKRLSNREIEATVTDESLDNAIALAYAAEIIICAWRTGTPGASLRSSSSVVDRAVDYGIEIPNIVDLWGTSAINAFFLSSVDFMHRSVVVENL
jgi:predicted oxidoreductase